MRHSDCLAGTSQTFNHEYGGEQNTAEVYGCLRSSTIIAVLDFSSRISRVTSSGSRIEMGGPRCKIFSHDPMSGVRGANGLVLVHIFIRER